MSRNEYVIRGGLVVDARNEGTPLDILVRDEKITALLSPNTTVTEGMPEVLAQGLHIFPGLIDAHVHFGFGEKITEYETESIYAAQGGVSTILGYFLNNEAYEDVYKREQEYAKERAYVDYGFHFSVANEEHIKNMRQYVETYGVTSFKYFMNFKGEEGRYLGLDGTDDGYFLEMLETAAEIGGVQIVCHTENIEIVNRLRRKTQSQGRNTLKDWCRSKPAFTEAENCVRAMLFAEHTGAHIYIPHLSSRLALDEVRRWRERYPHIIVETCPHYLTHTEDADIGSVGKANPPFRTQEDIDALWEGLRDGSINVVASDHVPRKLETKQRPIWLASQGFPGTATILPILLNEGYHKDRLSLSRIAELLTESPAKTFGLWPIKGQIAVGADADLTFVDLDKVRLVDSSELGSYSDYSLYDGWKLKGWPVRTIVRGKTVMQDGVITGQAGYGKYLAR